MAEGQELSRRKSSDFRGETTPPSAKSVTPLRGEVKSLRRGVAPLADISDIGFTTLLTAKRFDLIQTPSKVHNSLYSAASAMDMKRPEPRLSRLTRI